MSPSPRHGEDRRETARFASHFRVGCWRRRATGVVEKWSSPQLPFSGQKGEQNPAYRSAPVLFYLQGIASDMPQAAQAAGGCESLAMWWPGARCFRSSAPAGPRRR